MQKVIIIGRPNVGKSSLFNRLANKRIAITSDISGTTRDTNKVDIEIYDKACSLIDSGGLDDTSELFKNVQKKTLNEAKEADIILFMVDGKMAPDDKDKKIVYSLLKLKKPLCLVINKVDSKKDEARSFEFNEFGIKEMVSISVSHNTGIDELKDFIYPNLQENPVVDEEEYFEDFIKNFNEEEEFEKDFSNKNIRVGIIGRVNVGKSSLLNALVKDERSVVSDIEGTTIDPVNEKFVYENRVFEFVDTAGIRKRSKIEGIEKFALHRTKQVLENSDIALIVLDSLEPFTELDERIAGLASQYNLGVIIILNKWEDKSEKEFDEMCTLIKEKFKFLNYAPIISISALSGKRIHKLYPLILEIYENFTSKLKTSKLNEVIKEATILHPIPHDKGKRVKIYYAVQFGFAPPKIALIMNKPSSLHFSYKRYLTNQIRKNFTLNGVPLVLIPKQRGEQTTDENEEKYEKEK